MSEISDIFAKDPLHLTVEDRSAIVAYYRDNRHKYFLGTKKEPVVKLTAEEKKAQKALAGPKAKVDLGSLDLDL